MPDPSPTRDCTAYIAGHEVHWIQALHVANKPEVARQTVWGQLLDVTGTLIRIDFAGVVHGFHNHDPRRVSSIAPLPVWVSWNEQYCLLNMWHQLFSVSPEDRGPLGPCPTDVQVGNGPAESARRMGTHGGFSVRVGRRR
jgi:hypothetical protein